MVDIVKTEALKRLDDLLTEMSGIRAKGAAAIRTTIEKKRRFIVLYKVDAKLCKLMIRESKRDVKRFKESI